MLHEKSPPTFSLFRLLNRNLSNFPSTGSQCPNRQASEKLPGLLSDEVPFPAFRLKIKLAIDKTERIPQDALTQSNPFPKTKILRIDPNQIDRRIHRQNGASLSARDRILRNGRDPS